MKMYKKPSTEVIAVETDYMLLDPVSFGNSSESPTPPPVQAPRRGDLIP